MNTSLSPARRASELVSHMSVDQKVAELYGRGDFVHYGAANYIPAIPALCIPDLVYADGGAGLADREQHVTAFPDSITQAASWDRSLEARTGAAIGREAWHKGVDVQLAPGVDIARNPLNGRNFDYAGEDPYLAGQTGAAIVRGIQSQYVAATVKHFALNDQETDRMADSSDASVRTMEEIDLPPFETAIEQAHVAAVMCGYNLVNRVYDCQNRFLLRHVLEGQFRFPGWVMSDWGGTHSTVAAANAGLDQEQNVLPGSYFDAPLKRAVRLHKVSTGRLDDMVFRLMRSLFAVGVFDHPPAAEPAASTADVDTHREKARSLDAAEAGSVLLKNSRRILPLRRSDKHIAIIGLPASRAGAQLVYQAAGSSRVPITGRNPSVVDPLSAITTRAKADGDTVSYANGSSISRAAATARAADVAVVFVGDSEIEGTDRSTLNAVLQRCGLTVCTPVRGPAENSLVAAVAKANPHTIVVVQAGGPVAMPWLNDVRGVLDMWYPGEQDGNAAAALLFGDVDPSGKLPLTFPKSMTQTPIRSTRQWPGVPGAHGVRQSHYSEGLLVGYRWYDAKGIAPLFPFGYGKSYTRFRFSRLDVRRDAHGAEVRFVVTNVGGRPGAEVAQLYVGDPPAANEPPLQLKQYARVALKPGQRKVVQLRLDRRAFSYWSTHARGWRVAPGCYSIRVGDSSDHLPLRARVGQGGADC